MGCAYQRANSEFSLFLIKHQNVKMWPVDILKHVFSSQSLDEGKRSISRAICFALQKEPGTICVGGCVSRCVKVDKTLSHSREWNVVCTNPTSCVLNTKGSFTKELTAGS